MQANILVQKGATLGLLLETDLLIKLGFQVLQAPNEDGQIVELLHGHLWQTNLNTGKIMEKILSTNADMPTFESRLPANCDSGPVAPTGKPTPLPENTDQATVQVVTAEVKLLRAVKVPSRHAKRVTGHTNVPLGGARSNFGPTAGESKQ